MSNGASPNGSDIRDADGTTRVAAGRVRQKSARMARIAGETTCRHCGDSVAARYAFCPSCGVAMSATPLGDFQGAVNGNGQHANGEGEAMVARHRIGGTVHLVPAAPPAKASAEADPVATAPAAVIGGGSFSAMPLSEVTGHVSGVRRRRRRRRPRWYRRPLVVIPLVGLILVSVAAGLIFQKVNSTLSTVRSISTPPQNVEVAPEEEDVIAAGGDPAAGPLPVVQVDTGPAVAAVAESGRSADSGGGLFGGIRDTVSDATDMGRGAVAAAGIGKVSGPALTILVMGVDARPDEPIDIGVRPDVLMVVRLDPVAGECRLLSIPRDTRTELPGYGETKINHALMIGGIPYQTIVVEQLLDITIDRYLLIDFTGFKDLVDAVGGIEVAVPNEISRNGQVLFPAGLQTFDGDQALNYARYRDTATQGDVGRIKRQWSILRGLGDAVDGRDLARTVTELLPAVEDHLRTDLSTKEMVEIAKAYGGKCTPETVEPAMLDGFNVLLDDDPIFHMTLSYIVVEDAKIEERVAELMGT